MQLQPEEAKTPTVRPVFRIIKMKRRRPYPRLSWTKSEDELLRRLVVKHGERHWRRIEKEMRAKFPDLPINGKKCRERWINSVKCGVDRRSLTEREDLLLVIYHQTYSNSWAAIAKRIPNRNSSILKNNFYSLIKKIVRQVLLYKDGEVPPECTLLQFYSALYIVMILTELLETKAPTLELSGYRAPPHIAQYVLESKVEPRTCHAYILALRKAVHPGSVAGQRVVESLLGLDYVNLTRLCEQVAKVVLEYVDNMPPNEALCTALERVLFPQFQQPTQVQFSVPQPQFAGPSRMMALQPPMSQLQFNIQMPMLPERQVTQFIFASPTMGPRFFTTSMSYTSCPSTYTLQ
ncbi:MAG: Myb-like DNA-binding domain-containing protein [Candidatus Pacebacteria bacterium]|nr:Myb-like DNA-binding domain-containing protein [Candidatus Paceibacterota bacterium]